MPSAFGFLISILLIQELYTFFDWLKKGEDLKSIFDPLWFLSIWVSHYFPEFCQNPPLAKQHQPNSTIYGDLFDPSIAFS